MGLMAIEFNNVIREVHDWSWINSSVIDIYVDPSSNREYEDDFNASRLNCTWQVDSILNDFMFIQLNFIYPYEISPALI